MRPFYILSINKNLQQQETKTKSTNLAILNRYTTTKAHISYTQTHS